jgi:hypothetical protein
MNSRSWSFAFFIIIGFKRKKRKKESSIKADRPRQPKGNGIKSTPTAGEKWACKEAKAEPIFIYAVVFWLTAVFGLVANFAAFFCSSFKAKEQIPATIEMENKWIVFVQECFGCRNVTHTQNLSTKAEIIHSIAGICTVVAAACAVPPEG